MNNGKVTSYCSRGIRNNNPGNIRITSDKWQGQKPKSESQDKVFVTFYHVDFGLRALCVLLHNYIIMGYDTPRKIISRYAPPNENFTDYYVGFVASFFDNDEHHRISYNTDDFFRLMHAICDFESGYDFTFSHYKQLFLTFKLDYLK